jgi:RNA polymerase sigma factor (TIGR02999 family)
MSDDIQSDTTLDMSEGQTAEELLPILYQELRHLAARKMSREASGHTLQPTALVHEAYIRLTGSRDPVRWDRDPVRWDSAGHFYQAAAEAMRRILVESARRKRRLKRGGERRRTELDPVDLPVDRPPEEILALDEALETFAAEDPQSAELVKLRFFVGLTEAQAAATQGISPATARRHLAFARARLYQEIQGNE